MTIELKPIDQMIRGRKVDLRGQEFVIPPLTLADAEELEETIKKATSTDSAMSAKERFDGVCQVVQRAMVANYPAVTVEHLRHLLDYDSHLPAFLAAIGRDYDPNAEARRPTPATAAPSTGMPSTVS